MKSYIVESKCLPLTARQYGEVVLPDAASGQGPGTLARKLSRCKEGMASVFAVMVQILPKHYACRGTNLIGAGKLSRYRILIEGTGAVSRYKFDRSQEIVTVQDLYCGQVRASGCTFQQDLSWEQGFAKTVTNNLPILSVLAIEVC